MNAFEKTIDRHIEERHEARVQELLEANNALLERARTAERKLKKLQNFYKRRNSHV